jgi:hypothetical protein
MNNLPPQRNDEGPVFERLLRRIDNDDRRFNGAVRLGRNVCILSDPGAQRLGQCLLGATARGRVQFQSIDINPYYLTANAFQYSALLDFLTTGQYRHVSLDQNYQSWNAPEEPGMAAAMEHILNAMIANQVLASLTISGLSLTIPVLHLALQCPRVTLNHSPLQQQQLLVVPRINTSDHPAAAAAALRNSPERGSDLCLSSEENDLFVILPAATALQTNVARLNLCFYYPIGGRLDFSSLTGFLTIQPNSVALTLTFLRPDRIDTDAIVEHILADVLTQCPGVHALWPLFFHERFFRVTELVSNTALERLVVNPPDVLSLEQQEQIAVITQRNGVIPAYLQTTYLLKQRRPPAVNDPSDPPIMLYNANDDAEDRPKHQFVLSHALRQAAVHPIFFSHFYEYVRNHADELYGGTEGRHQQRPPHRRRRQHGAS